MDGGGTRVVVLKSNYIITGLDRGDTLAYGFDDSGTFMAKDDWESAFRIFPR